MRSVWVNHGTDGMQPWDVGNLAVYERSTFFVESCLLRQMLHGPMILHENTPSYSDDHTGHGCCSELRRSRLGICPVGKR